jgi:hypothetical protein
MERCADYEDDEVDQGPDYGGLFCWFARLGGGMLGVSIIWKVWSFGFSVFDIVEGG